MTNSPSKNIWDDFIKTIKTGTSRESLNAEFFQFPAKTIKSFVLSSWLGKFPVAIAIGGGSKASFSISRDHMTNESRDLVGEIPSSYIIKVKARATELNNKNIYVLQIGASLYYRIGAALFYKLGKRFIITN